MNNYQKYLFQDDLDKIYTLVTVFKQLSNYSIKNFFFEDFPANPLTYATIKYNETESTHIKVTE